MILLKDIHLHDRVIEEEFRLKHFASAFFKRFAVIITVLVSSEFLF